MRRPLSAILAAATLAACQAAPTPVPRFQPAASQAAGSRELVVSLGVQGAARTLQVWIPSVSNYEVAHVHHVKVTLSSLASGESVVDTRTFTRAQLGATLRFAGLAADTAYRIRAKAYKASAEVPANLISDDDASKIDLIVPASGTPASVIVPVQLGDNAGTVPFVSTLAGNIAIADVSGSTNGPAIDARFNGPQQLALGPNGILYVADEMNHLIRSIDTLNPASATAVQTFVGSTQGASDASALFNRPQGVAVASDGTVYVADTFNNCIRRVLANKTVRTIAGNITTQAGGHADGIGNLASFNRPWNLALDEPNGILYVTDQSNHCVRKLTLPAVSDPTGNAVVAVLAGDLVGQESASIDGPVATARFRFPAGIALAANGDLYVSESYLIRRIDMSNPLAPVVSTIAGDPVHNQGGKNDGIGKAARFDTLRGLAIDGDALFVADANNNVIRKVDISDPENAVVTTFAGNLLVGEQGRLDGSGLTARFVTATGLGVGGAGKLYVSDSGNDVIRKIQY